MTSQRAEHDETEESVPIRRTLAILAVAAVALVAEAFPVLAHPTFSPGSAPAGTPTVAELIIPHGCALDGGMPEAEDDQSPTRIVDVQVPDGATITPHPRDGWTLEVREDGFAWTAEAPDETTLRFDVDIQLDGEDGDRRYVGIYQECVNGESFSWIGTPDREAENPAAILTVGEKASGHEHAAGHGTDDGHASEHVTDMGLGTEGMTDVEMTEHMTEPEIATAGDAASDADSSLVEILVVLGSAVLVLGGGLLVVRGRRTSR
ncbi:MAG: DUF1775 domain-containing protein [Nitriliruptorales bacterium]|nr:DUF1775 domain-containing protein [Nitriliruptorales bacterium]